jgi:hypothetical protein
LTAATSSMKICSSLFGSTAGFAILLTDMFSGRVESFYIENKIQVDISIGSSFLRSSKQVEECNMREFYSRNLQCQLKEAGQLS